MRRSHDPEPRPKRQPPWREHRQSGHEASSALPSRPSPSLALLSAPARAEQLFLLPSQQLLVPDDALVELLLSSEFSEGAVSGRFRGRTDWSGKLRRSLCLSHVYLGLSGDRPVARSVARSVAEGMEQVEAGNSAQNGSRPSEGRTFRSSVCSWWMYPIPTAVETVTANSAATALRVWLMHLS